MKKNNQLSLKKLTLSKKTISFLGPKSSSQFFGEGATPGLPPTILPWTYFNTCPTYATCNAAQSCVCPESDYCPPGGGTEDCSRDCGATDGDCITLTLSGAQTCDCDTMNPC